MKYWTMHAVFQLKTETSCSSSDTYLPVVLWMEPGTGQGAGNADRLQGREANTGTQTHPAQPSSPCQQPPEMFHDELSPLLNQAVSTMDATTGNRNTAWSGGFKASSLRMYG